MTAPSGVLNVTGGNFTYTGGTYNANLGTVTYSGNLVSPTVSVGTGPVRFYNFQDALTGSYPTGLTITGTLTVANTFTWKLGSGIINGNIEAQGDVDDQNHGGTGNPYFTLDGTGNQTIKDTSGVKNYTGVIGGDMRGLAINKPSANQTLEKRVSRNPVPPNHARNAVSVTKLNGDTVAGCPAFVFAPLLLPGTCPPPPCPPGACPPKA